MLTKKACFCLTFDVAKTAMGNVSEKKEKKTREKKKKVKKKGSNPQLQVCYTFVAPAEVHNRVDDKGPGPMQPIVAWRTIWRL